MAWFSALVPKRRAERPLESAAANARDGQLRKETLDTLREIDNPGVFRGFVIYMFEGRNEAATPARVSFSGALDDFVSGLREAKLRRREVCKAASAIAKALISSGRDPYRVALFLERLEKEGFGHGISRKAWTATYNDYAFKVTRPNRLGAETDRYNPFKAAIAAKRLGRPEALYNALALEAYSGYNFHEALVELEREFPAVLLRRKSNDVSTASEEVRTLFEIYERNRMPLADDGDVEQYYRKVSRELLGQHYNRLDVERLPRYLGNRDAFDAARMGLFFAAIINPRLKDGYSVDLHFGGTAVEMLCYKLERGKVRIFGSVGFDAMGGASENLYRMDGGEVTLNGDKISGVIGKGATGGRILIRNFDKVDDSVRIDPSCKASVLARWPRRGLTEYLPIESLVENGLRS